MQFCLIWGWAALPIYVNASVALADRDYFWLPITACLGLAAPYCIWLAEKAFSRGDRAWGAIMTLVGLLVLAMNLTNAVGSAAQHRANKAAPLEDKIRIEAALRAQEAEIADKLARLGWVTRGDDQIVIARAIEQLKSNPLFKRSGECRDVTKDDSGGFCSNLRGEEARLLAAQKIEGMERERKELRNKVLINEAPKVADVQLGTLKRLLSRVVDIDESFLAAGLAGLLSVVVEILGTVVPAAASQHYARPNGVTVNKGATGPKQKGYRKPHSTKQEAPTESPYRMAETGHSVIQKALSDRLYIMEKFEPCAGGKLIARPAYSDYAKWCKQKGLPAESETTFSETMANCGYTKKLVDRRQHYTDVGLQKVKLEVVKS